MNKEMIDKICNPSLQLCKDMKNAILNGQNDFLGKKRNIFNKKKNSKESGGHKIYYSIPNSINRNESNPQESSYISEESLFYNLVAKKGRTKIMSIYSKIKSTFGNLSLFEDHKEEFTKEELSLIYNVLFKREKEKSFTELEDQILMEKMKEFNNYRKVATFFKYKTPGVIKARYQQLKILNQLDYNDKTVLNKMKNKKKEHHYCDNILTKQFTIKGKNLFIFRYFFTHR